MTERFERVKKNYDELAKRLKLPSREKISKEFLIGFEDVAEGLELETIVLMIGSRLHGHASKDIEPIVYNPVAPCCKVERSGLKTEDLDRAIKLYRELMGIYWESKFIANKNDKEKAAWVKDVYEKWANSLKKEYLWFENKISEAWKSKPLEKASLVYHG